MDTHPRPLERDFGRALKLADRIGASTPYTVEDPSRGYRIVNPYNSFWVATVYASRDEARRRAMGEARHWACELMRDALYEEREWSVVAPPTATAKVYVAAVGAEPSAWEPVAFTVAQEEVTL